MGKFPISLVYRLTGEYQGNGALISHAWFGSANRNFSERLHESAISRSAYVFSFKTDPIEIKPGLEFPNYSPIGILICTYLSILYGKRFDFHGVIENFGQFYLPDLTAFYQLCDPKIPQNSHSPRKDLEIPLNLTEFSKIEKLLLDKSLDERFIRTLQSAGRFYLQALRNVEHDPETAYLHLITAGEILSNYREYNKDELLDEKMLKTLKKIEEEMDDGSEIIKDIKNRLYQVKRKFIKMISYLINENFFNCTESLKELMALKQENFESRIKATYDLRSEYVHTGVSFGKIVSPSGDLDNAEIILGRHIIKNEKFRKILDKSLTFTGLERIMRYCLLRFIHINGIFIDSRLDVD